MAIAINWRGIEQAHQKTIPSASQHGFGVQRFAITRMNQISFVSTCLEWTHSWILSVAITFSAADGQ